MFDTHIEVEFDLVTWYFCDVSWRVSSSNVKTIPYISFPKTRNNKVIGIPALSSFCLDLWDPENCNR